MFLHNFKYSLKTLFKSKMLIFWTFAFPIILGTLFSLAFSNIENSEKLDIIPIAIVYDEEFNNDILLESFKELSSEENENRLFNTQYKTEKEAEEMLQNKTIDGYIILDDLPKVVVKASGANETVIKYVVEEVFESTTIVSNLANIRIAREMESGNANIDYEKIYRDLIKEVQETNINLKDVSRKNLSYMMIEFYTLIAMTCLYSGILAMVSLNKSLANMSKEGKRVSIAPTKKWRLLISSILASYCTQIIGLSLLFLYTIFVLNVDYGNSLFLIILLALIGSLAGLAIGVFTSSVFKLNENTKTGIIIAISMFCCFLSGMMGVTMKYVIDKNIPIINMLNPANMITDGFYALYYYDTLDRYWFNLMSLLLFSACLLIISTICLRRQKYDSI